MVQNETTTGCGAGRPLVSAGPLSTGPDSLRLRMPLDEVTDLIRPPHHQVRSPADPRPGEGGEQEAKDSQDRRCESPNYLAPHCQAGSSGRRNA